MIVRLLVMLLLAASTASAGEKSILVFAAGYDSLQPSAVRILQRADYASMTVTISSVCILASCPCPQNPGPRSRK